MQIYLKYSRIQPFFFIAVFSYIYLTNPSHLCKWMNGIIKIVKNIEIIRENSEPELFAIKATGVAELRRMLAPLLVSSKNYNDAPKDGIYELDFVLGDTSDEITEVEMEVDVVFKFKKLPEWVRAIKVNATENSDIEIV